MREQLARVCTATKLFFVVACLATLLASAATVRAADTTRELSVSGSAAIAPDFPCRFHDCCCAEQGWCKPNCCCFPNGARLQSGGGARRTANATTLAEAELAAVPHPEPASRRSGLSNEPCHGRGHPVTACGIGPGASAHPSSSGVDKDVCVDTLPTSPRGGESAPQSRRLEPPTPPPRGTS